MPTRFPRIRGGSHSPHRRPVVPYGHGVAFVLSVSLLSVPLSSAATTTDVEARLEPVSTDPEQTVPADLDPQTGQLLSNPDEEISGAPIDRGDPAASLRSSASRTGDPAYRKTGSWSPAMTWPQVPIHASLTPDGRVMTFGTDAGGNQGAQFGYSVWDPVNGEHLVLPNTTSTTSRLVTSMPLTPHSSGPAPRCSPTKMPPSRPSTPSMTPTSSRAWTGS